MFAPGSISPAGSTTSLPSYVAPSLHSTPSYTAEPNDDEQRIALADQYCTRPSGKFIKQSKNGWLKLILDAQQEGVAMPLYGKCASVVGTVNVNTLKIGGIESIEIKVNGRLSIKQLGEGGDHNVKVCLANNVLWNKDDAGTPSCPATLPFNLELPPTLSYDTHTFPLPPTFDVKLKGLPGFIASTEYSIVVSISKGTPVPLVKSNLFNLTGETSISTPFTYYPRTRPATPLPSPLTLDPTVACILASSHPEWYCHTSKLVHKASSEQNLSMRFYIPASRTFCVKQTIPFHLLVEGRATALVAFLPSAPSIALASDKQATKVQLLRQSRVDIGAAEGSDARAEMWRVDCIGEGSFKPASEGPTGIYFSGEIHVFPSVKVTGFRAGGLSVQDYIALTIAAPDLKKACFADLRQVIPVRLATDAWTANGAGLGAR